LQLAAAEHTAVVTNMTPSLPSTATDFKVDRTHQLMAALMRAQKIRLTVRLGNPQPSPVNVLNSATAKRGIFASKKAVCL
jgi:hypothetical protein